MAHLKEKVLALLDYVSRPPGTALPRGATEQELTNFSTATGLMLPEELKEWLRACNSPCVGPGGIYGVSPALEWLAIKGYLELEPRWKQKGWIPVAGDGTGNQYVLDTKGA